jgi:hypothetical protein
MYFRKISLLAACLGLFAVAFADDEAQTSMTISITDESGDGDVRFKLDSDIQDLNLEEMQEGENRSIIDESGRAILVTREADGFRFDVDGKSVRMPLFPTAPNHTVRIGERGAGDVQIHVTRAPGEPRAPVAISMANPVTMSMTEMPAIEGVMIISDKTIDASTQQGIRGLLESAGHSGDVRFVGGDQTHGEVHGFTVIEKTVEVIE